MKIVPVEANATLFLDIYPENDIEAYCLRCLVGRNIADESWRKNVIIHFFKNSIPKTIHEGSIRMNPNTRIRVIIGEDVVFDCKAMELDAICSSKCASLSDILLHKWVMHWKGIITHE